MYVVCPFQNWKGRRGVDAPHVVQEGRIWEFWGAIDEYETREEAIQERDRINGSISPPESCHYDWMGG